MEIHEFTEIQLLALLQHFGCNVLANHIGSELTEEDEESVSILAQHINIEGALDVIKMIRPDTTLEDFNNMTS